MSIQPILLLLIRMPWWRAKNRLRHARTDDLLKNLFLLSFGLAVCWAEYSFFDRFWNVLARVPMGYPVVFPRMMSLLGSFLFAFLVYSSMLTALSVLYHSEDVALLIAMPVPNALILLFKWVEIAWRSGVTFLALSIPPVLALSRHLALAPSFYAAYGLAVLALAVTAVSTGMLAAMGLMLIFPERRLHQSVALVGLCLAAILLTGLRFLHLESLWSEQAGESPLMLFFTQESGEPWRYSPAVFLPRAVMPFLWGEAGGGPWLAGGTFASLAVLGLCLALGARIFLAGWRKGQEQADPLIGVPTPLRRRARFENVFSPSFRALMQKDWVMLKREPAVWTQLFMMVPLSAMYLLNLFFLPLDIPELRSFYAVGNVALIGLIIASISARYLFPTASREGRAVWIPAASPIPSRLYLMQKILFSCPPVIFLGLVLLTTSTWMLHMPPELCRWTYCYGIFSTVLLCLMAVALGCCFPIFDYSHLLEVSLGKGAILYMMLALAQVGSLAYAALREAYANPDVSLSLAERSLVVWLAAWGAVTALSLWLGKRKMETWEWK